MRASRTLAIGLVTLSCLAIAPVSSHAQRPDGFWNALQAFDGGPAVTATSQLFLDEARARFVFYSRAGIWTAPLDGSATWSQVPAGNHPPLPADAIGYLDEDVVFDAATDRLILSHGSTETVSRLVFAATYALDLDDAAPAWTKLCDGGSMNRSVLVLEPASRRLATFGGDYDAIQYSTTATMPVDGTPAWTTWPSWPAVATAPYPREDHQAFLDPVRHGMWLLPGGQLWPGASDPPGKMWFLDLNGNPAWSLADVIGTGPNVGPVVHDPQDGRFLFAVGSVWSLTVAADGSSVTWEQLNVRSHGPRNGPGYPRHAAFDVGEHRLLVYDGRMWEYDLDEGPGQGHAQQTAADPPLVPVAESPRSHVTGDALAGRSLVLRVPSATSGGVVVRLSPASAAPARLELLDVAGRRLDAREVAASSGGTRELTLSAATRLAPGVYLVRATQDGHTVTSRAVVFP